MDENNPFEDVFHQINDLLQMIADNADKPLKHKIPMDIEAKIGKLERQVEEFKKASKAYISQLGITDEDMNEYLKKVAQASSKNTRKIFERTEKLKEQIEKKKAFLEGQSKQETRAPTEDISISEQKHLEKRTPTARKSLFKRIGGNNKWRPL